MNWRSGLAFMLCAVFVCCTCCEAQNMVNNGSFESGTASWVVNPLYAIQVRSSGWSGVGAADGNSFLAVSGPASVGYTYAQLVTQSLSAPFGNGIPDDNFTVYLYAAVYLHTNDGRRVSYAFAL